jgi:KipI family sensor histidine kinase inhibitor
LTTTESRPAGVRFLPSGEQGLLVELAGAIDPGVNARVHQLARAVTAHLADLVLEVVPTYRSLLVIFDPLRVARETLAHRIELLVPAARPGAVAEQGRLVTVPVCYGGDLGPDLELVAHHNGLSCEEVIALHVSATYLVFMLGFTPGFAYLGGMSKRISTPRLDRPRPLIPGGSVGIAGEQTGIYPIPSPAGWRIIGRTPLRLFDPGAATPFLLAAGDRVRFAPIELDRFEAISAQVEAGRYVPHVSTPTPTDHDPDRDRGEGRNARRRGHVITVVKPGLLTTVQDEGRPGYRAFGMPVAGAIDRRAYRVVNLLAGNAPGAAALEMTLLGGTFRFEQDTVAAVCGAEMRAALDGEPVRTPSSFAVRAGATLVFASAAAGVRCYLGVRGGIDVPAALGSRSTYTRAGVGGLGGRPLEPGDVLPLGEAAPPGHSTPMPRLPYLAQDFLPAGGEVRLRVLLGPQDDYFTPEGLATFFGSAYKVTNRNDRMGYQLEGPAVAHSRGPDIVSDALCPGAVQVPGSGMPIVMMADCQTTGGYAKLGYVIGPDLGKLAQARFGDRVRFERCTEAQAVEALRAEKEACDRLAAIVGAKEGA